MKKQEVLKKLTELYDICDDQSEHADDGWRNIALAISTAENVAQKEITWDNQYPQSADHESDNFIKKENMEAVIAKSHEWFAEIKDRTDDEQYCCGFEIGDQIIDINIYDGEKLCEDNKWHCEVIECFDDENGCHARGDRYQYLWSIDKGDDNAPS